MRYTSLHKQLRVSLQYLENKLKGYQQNMDVELKLHPTSKIYTEEKREKLKQDIVEMKAALSGIWEWRKKQDTKTLKF